MMATVKADELAERGDVCDEAKVHESQRKRRWANN